MNEIGVEGPMRITTLTWDKVTVTCPSDPSKGETFKAATITVEDDAVTIRYYLQGGYRSAMYRKPTLVSLTPYGFKFEAFWWSVRWADEYGDDCYQEAPVTIEGFFNTED